MVRLCSYKKKGEQICPENGILHVLPKFRFQFKEGSSKKNPMSPTPMSRHTIRIRAVKG